MSPKSEFGQGMLAMLIIVIGVMLTLTVGIAIGWSIAP